MSEAPRQRQAIFEGLVFDQGGQPLQVTYLGGEPHYVIDDAGFKRHVEAAHIDRQVLESMQGQIDENKAALEEGILHMLGQDDLFTKAAIDTSLSQIDRLLQNGIPLEARQWLGLMGFRVIVDIHGEVVNIEGGGIAGEEDE
ncbi:MAG TPA: hypothetical protein VJG32_17065 [Anaerolineae bacterium]|nr:hypothetical protein [Anaerolineae bacterium]